MKLAMSDKKMLMGGFDKRETPRIKLASIVPMDSSKWDLELSKPANGPELEKLLSIYRDENIEDNIFFDKTFLTAAFGRMNALETSLITVWETIDSVRHLRMYFPVVPDRLGFPSTKVWRCWSHDYAPLGVPIVSHYDAGEVLDRFLQLMAQVDNKNFRALVFEDIPTQGVFASRMGEALDDSDTPYCKIATGERAQLCRDRGSPTATALNITAKKRRQLGRQLRRLGELGNLQLERVDQYDDVILRFEEFMLLEACGWKGRKGTSMHTIKQTAAFARQAITELAKQNNCTIFSIRLDGKSIASLIVLKSQGVYFPWKIAFDQNYAHYSPGALLMFNVSEEISCAADFIRADSLASTSSQLVNPLWKRRMALSSFILPIGDSSRPRLDKLARAIMRKQNWHHQIKSVMRKMAWN